MSPPIPPSARAARRVLVTGARGMLGSDVCAAAPPDVTLVAVDIEDFDITDARRCQEAIAAARPDVVIHCAAYTNVDGCERDPETAFKVNSEGARNVAEGARACGARLLYLSTDYVFAGDKGEPYLETDQPTPLGVYGESKLRGEQYVRELVADHLVVRSQWLFGRNGRSFVDSILRAAEAGRELRVVNDQWGAATYTKDLAGGLWLALGLLAGTYHLTNAGSGTWYEVAVCALRAAGMGQVPVQPISSSEWPTPTRRPAYSVLANKAWLEAGRAPLRPWQEAVADFVKNEWREGE